jgi:hypothetical protein
MHRRGRAGRMWRVARLGYRILAGLFVAGAVVQ